MKILIICLSTLIGTIAYSQENCSNFKTGKFQNIENGIIKSKIQRNDSIQTEQYGDKEIKLKIEWINDCSYKLKFLEGNTAFWNSRPKNKPTPDLIVKITQTNGNSYLQQAKFVDEEDFNYKSQITKIE